MKMRPGTQTGFLMCGKEWIDGETLEVRSPWDQGLVGRVSVGYSARRAPGSEPRGRPACGARARCRAGSGARFWRMLPRLSSSRGSGLHN